MKCEALGNALARFGIKTFEFLWLFIGLTLILTEQSRIFARRALTGLPKVIALDIPPSRKMFANASSEVCLATSKANCNE